MPNVIDIKPLRALAKRASERISDPAISERFERLALDRLLHDPRNFRAARKSDLVNAPEWAKTAAARGEEVSVYRANGALAARMHTVARRLDEARVVASTDPTERPDYIEEIADAREFIAKFGRVNFDTASRKALTFSRVYGCWQESDDAISVCEAHTLALLGGRAWHRITSVVELRKVGEEFRNCLARTTRTSAYGSQLAQGRAQFWVLRDLASGRGLIVAMAQAPLATQFIEVKGPNNIPVRSDDESLLQLGILIGVRSTTPEPPPPSPPGSPRAVAALLTAALEPCRCALCMPHLRRPLRLRRSVGAP